MPKVHIWTPESNTDSQVVKIIGDKIAEFYKEEITNIKIIPSGKSTYNAVASEDSGLFQAVQNHLKQCELVIFLLDFDGIQSNAQRKKEPNSHINKITAVINQIPNKVKLLYIHKEIEAWLLIDCLGICCYFKNDEAIRQNKEWIRFAKNHQLGKTDLITEAERGGSNAKEHLVRFSRQIIKKIKPKLTRQGIAREEYTEDMSKLVVKFVHINQETINRNDSLKDFADLLYKIAKKSKKKTKQVTEK